MTKVEEYINGYLATIAGEHDPEAIALVKTHVFVWVEKYREALGGNEQKILEAVFLHILTEMIETIEKKKLSFLLQNT